MGSPIIGRTPCPECGFGSAHVKRSPKCVYRHCVECGAMYHATGAERERRLMAVTRPVEAAPAPEPEPTKPPPAPTPAPAPALPVSSPPASKRRGLFS